MKSGLQMVHQSQKPQIKDILKVYLFFRGMGKNKFLFVVSSQELMENSVYTGLY